MFKKILFSQIRNREIFHHLTESFCKNWQLAYLQGERGRLDAFLIGSGASQESPHSLPYLCRVRAGISSSTISRENLKKKKKRR